MKFIPIKDHGKEGTTTHAVIKSILAAPLGERGVDYNEMKKRFRIEDAFAKAGADGVRLEDADYEHLKKLAEQLGFREYNRDAFAVIRVIVEDAESVE